MQVAGTIQPQLHTGSAAATAAGPINVTAATDAPVPLSGLAMEIAASAQSGKSRFEIRLDPAELGRIDVRIDVDRHGHVTSHLTVEKPETLSMLRQDAAQLQRALDDAGLSTGNSGLQFSLRDQSSSGQDDGNESSPNATSPDRQRGRQHAALSSPDAAMAACSVRAAASISGSEENIMAVDATMPPPIVSAPGTEHRQSTTTTSSTTSTGTRG